MMLPTLNDLSRAEREAYEALELHEDAYAAHLLDAGEECDPHAEPREELSPEGQALRAAWEFAHERWRDAFSALYAGEQLRAMEADGHG